jgi:menaquinone-9 beta-reductase
MRRADLAATPRLGCRVTVAGRHWPAQTDVFIVGGGPAGLAAAIAARQHGLSVTVADGAEPPIDKACGEGVMPNGIAALRELGVSIPPHESMSFRGIRFIGSGRMAEANFRREPGRGVRRTVLHHVLVDRAQTLGVTLAWRTPVRGLTPYGVDLETGPVACRFVIGADGEGSRVRRWAGLGSVPPAQRFGFRQHFGVRPWAAAVEVYWCDGAQVFVTPVAPAEVCVALISRDPRLRLDKLFDVCPALAPRLAGAPAATAERGGPSASRRLQAVTRGRIALVGDASGSLDGITGEGLSILFQHALALGRALKAGDLSRYERAHSQLGRNPALMARLLLMMDRWRWLRHRALHALAAEPSLFSRLLTMHVGTPASPRETVESVFALCWRLLMA